MSSVFEESFVIKYDDIDANTQKISDLAFLRFFQYIAGRHADSLGYGLKDIPRTNLTWLVLGWKFEVFNRPLYGDKILIKTWSRKAIKSIYYRDFEVFNENGEKICIATSKWVLINTVTHEMVFDNSEISKKFSPNNVSVFDSEMKKIILPEHFDNSFDYKILRRDIDTNNHVNNTSYLSIAYECLPESIYKNLIYNSVEIMYKSECSINDTVTAKFTKIDENSFILVVSNAVSNDLHWIIKYQKK